MNLFEMRKKKNLTMRQLADSVGITESMVSLIESGQRCPSVKVLRRIAAALGCTLDDLLQDDQKE